MVDYVAKFKLLFASPTEFFKSVESEKQFWPILRTYVILYAIIAAISFLVSIPETIQLAQEGGAAIYLMTLVYFLFGVGFAFAIPFIGAGMTHLGVLVFGGKQPFFNTFKPVSYSLMVSLFYSLVNAIFATILYLTIPAAELAPETPEMLLLGIITIPVLVSLIIALAGLVHSVFVEIKGIMHYQKMTGGKATLAVFFVPVILVILFSIFFFGLFLLLVGSGIGL